MAIQEVLTSEHHKPVKIWTTDADEKSKQQLKNVASMPFIHHHVAAMPDVHVGIGATIGSVIATHKAIIPAAVGVDLGCFHPETKILAPRYPWAP
jgi:tRNA-splicing ligase RtcB